LGFDNKVHFRTNYHNNLSLSSLGIGSYIGAPDVNDDIKLFGAIIESVKSGGVNVIDTAINYRYMKSERVIGAALRYLNYPRE
jgi:aryl-alcohol dehydrogenase-like predicted oxidoreductase